MIDFYTWPTPNGRKISILLEEINTPYKVIPVDITNNEQFSKEYTTISPSNKIPAIVDKENNQSIFETGAIMLYLSKKYNKFLPTQYYYEVMQWFFFQISQVVLILVKHINFFTIILAKVYLQKKNIGIM